MKSSQKINVIMLVFIFGILVAIQLIFDIDESRYYFDAANYNEIGKSLFLTGKYSLKTISNDFRGFAFPSLLGLCDVINTFFETNRGFQVVSSFILSILFVAYLNCCKAWFYKLQENNIKLVIRNISVIFFIVIFFYGLIIYPLTDLYAALMCIISGYLIYASYDMKKLYQYISIGFAGSIIYWAYNIRTIYQLSIFLFCGLLVFFTIKNRQTIRKLVASLSIYILGVVIAAIPQFIINWNIYEKISPWINNQNLFAQQLYWGLQYSRYATYIGNNIEHSAGMYFGDAAGMKIAQEWSTQNLPLTLKSYIMLFIRHPLDFIAIMGKHFYNACFVLFPEQYVRNLKKNLGFGIVSSIIIIFLFLLVLWNAFHVYRVKMENVFLFLCIVFPSIAIMFGAVEERFMVLPYMLIYGMIAFFDYSEIKKKINKKNVVCCIIIFGVFLITALAIESEILSSMNDLPLLF